MENLVEKINRLQNKHGEDAFEITNIAISDALNNSETIKVIYDNGDLTKNFVRFSTDLLSGRFGEHFMDEIILAFGETLKTNKNDFKESYRNKPSSIKEILPSVFIHTSMSKVLMEILIVELVTKARLSVKFYDIAKWKSEEPILSTASKFKSVTDFAKNSPDVYRAAVKHGMLEKIALEIKKNKEHHRLFR